MSYGQEVPFEYSACVEESSCAVSENQQVTVTSTYSIDTAITIKRRDLSAELHARDVSIEPELELVFNAGASYSWSTSVTYGTTQTYSQTFNGTTCGYWTFIPYMME
jgi:hypothetical protein